MKKVLGFTVLLVAQVSFAAAVNVKSAPTAGKVEFEAVGRPSMLKIKGEGEGVTSNLAIDGNKISGDIGFKVSSLKTGIDMRDEHMKEKYLQTKQYPDAKLVFTQFQMPSAWSLQNPKVASAPFKGKLTLHGVEREVSGVYTIETAQLKTNAQFEIKLSDFKIDIPAYLGVKVADNVKVNISIDKMNLAK